MRELQELLAMPVKLLGSKPLKEPARARLDLLRCEENGVFLTVESRAGSIFNYIAYATEAEALIDYEVNASGPNLPPSVAALLFEEPAPEPPIPEQPAPPKVRAELSALLALPGLECLSTRAVSGWDQAQGKPDRVVDLEPKRLDLVRCAGVFLVIESVSGGIVQTSRYAGEVDARRDLETNFSRLALPAAVEALLAQGGN